MKKWFVVVLIIGVLFLGLGAIGFWRLTEHTVPAQVVYGGGQVFVNGEAILKNEKLREDDVVTTHDGTATVLLYESVFVQMDPQTQITLTTVDPVHPKVVQKEGKVAVSFVHATSVKEFSLTNGNETYMVNGTFFTFDQIAMLVEEGRVFASRGKISIYVAKGFSASYNTVTSAFEQHTFTAKENSEMQLSVDAAILALRKQREAEVRKYPELIAAAISTTGKTEEQLLATLDAYDNKTAEEVDAAVANLQAYAKNNLLSYMIETPAMRASVKKVTSFTKQIQLMQQYSA